MNATVTGNAYYFRHLARMVDAFRACDAAAVEAAFLAWGPHQDATAAACFRETMRADAWSMLSDDERRAYNRAEKGTR